jgi:hypothetical protein
MKAEPRIRSGQYVGDVQLLHYATLLSTLIGGD